MTGPYYLPNGTYDPTVDAGFIPDCLLEVTISEVSECMFTDPGQEREILVDITWNNAVYTYDFLGGVDTIQLDILGQTFQYEIDTLNGDTSQLVIMDASTTMDILAEVSLLIDDDCITTDEILDVIACTYDVALIKEVVDFPPYMYGDILTYNITVQNQGEQDVNNVVINDFLPSGFVFDAGANPDWVETTFDTLTYTIDDTLVAGETRIIPLMLELVMSSEVGAYLNTSEIGSFQDTTGMDRSDQDIDSAPDNDPTNDGGGAPNSGSDNTLDGDGSGAPGSTNPNTDEDDQDPELITIVDLALVKRILTPGPYNYGDPIEFEITVYNQGNVTASNVAVIDYIPAGFSFDPVNMPNWMLSGSNAIDTIPGPLMTGDSASTTITLILEMADPSEYVNVAEIFYFENDDGFDISGQDIDSDADQTNGNDAGGNPGTDSDNVANGDGTGSAGGTDPSTDEDDSDPAYISVPMIDVEKTTTSIVPAQSGIDGNFDATFELVITNPGNIKLTCILLQDDLAEQLGGTFVGLAAAPITIDVTDASEVPPIVMGYNGGVIDTIFSGVSGCLRPGETITIELVVEVNSLTGPEPIINEANVSGKDTLGIVVMDKDTALVATPDCFLSVICPIDQVDLKCLNELPPAGTTAAWFNAIDGISSIENACGTPTIVVNDTDNGGAGCVTDTLFVTRQIIVNDPGDGTTVPQADTCEILYTIVDDVKPIVMNTPIDLVLECGVDNTAAIMDWEMTIGGAAIVDECGALTITFVEETPITECGGTSRTPYTLTATDACGNFVTRTANLILIDTQDPVLTLPTGASTVSCDAGPDADAWAATASAMDENSCDSAPTVSYSLINVVESCAGTTQNTTYTYLFTAVDACGNESESMTADYVITDAEAPTLTAPPTLNITCGQDISLLVAEWLDDVVLDDNCDDASDLVVTNDYDATALLDACGATIPVTWTITDDCGGTSTAMANIVIAADATGPTMTCVPTLTFAIDVDDCGANLAIPLPTATDCNGVASIVQTSPAPNTEFSIGSTIVTFTATDNCGNESTCTTNVIVEDTQNPELLCPPSINRCATAGTCTWTSDASVNPLTSDCGATTLTYSVANADGSTSTPAAIEGYVFMLGSSVVTVTSTDNADPTNATMCSFTVTITDCEAPSMTTCPAPQTMVECGMEDVATWAATLVGTDFCDATLTESYYILSQRPDVV